MMNIEWRGKERRERNRVLPDTLFGLKQLKDWDAREGRYKTQKELYLGVGKISSQNSRNIHMCVSKAPELFKDKLQDTSEEVCMERERTKTEWDLYNRIANSQRAGGIERKSSRRLGNGCLRNRRNPKKYDVLEGKWGKAFGERRNGKRCQVTEIGRNTDSTGSDSWAQRAGKVGVCGPCLLPIVPACFSFSQGYVKEKKNMSKQFKEQNVA